MVQNFCFLCHTYYHPQLWAKPKEKLKYQWGENQIITKFHRKVYKHLSLSSSLVIAPSPCPLPPYQLTITTRFYSIVRKLYCFLKITHNSVPHCNCFGDHGEWKIYLSTKIKTKVANWRSTDLTTRKRS